jgi:hypothetical protein
MDRTIVPAAMQRNDRYKMASFLDSIPEVVAEVEQFLQARVAACPNVSTFPP